MFPAGPARVQVTGDISESCFGSLRGVGWWQPDLSGLENDSDPVFKGLLASDSFIIPGLPFEPGLPILILRLDSALIRMTFPAAS